MTALASLDPRELEAAVRGLIRAQRSVLVALSGGVDSSVIAALAAEELGPRALAVTGMSASVPGSDLESARALCERLGLRHVEARTDELQVSGYVENSPDRCYWCKNELYDVLARVGSEHQVARILDGTNADDVRGHRPGHRAAREHDVLSPLLEAGAGKTAVRALARRLGLPDADRPASPCLSSRIAYGVAVTGERLRRVGAAEVFLRSLGFTDVRVRLHDAIARVEVPPADIPLAVEHHAAIDAHLRELGFTYVTLDLRGLRSGSLLEIIDAP
jgi:uncharacterized protein